MKITGMIEASETKNRSNYLKKKLLEGNRCLQKPLAFQKGPSLGWLSRKNRPRAAGFKNTQQKLRCCRQEAFFTSAQIPKHLT